VKFCKYRKIAFPISFFSLKAPNFGREKEDEGRREEEDKKEGDDKRPVSVATQLCYYLFFSKEEDVHKRQRRLAKSKED
jgi:hypothetical protein